MWAGLLALINQGLGRNVGFLNPALYQIPPSSGATRDITAGNNGDYQAGPGWDPCTGLGAPDGRKLLAALQAPTSAIATTPQITALGDGQPAEILAEPNRALLWQYLRTTEKLIELAGARPTVQPQPEPVPFTIPLEEAARRAFAQQASALARQEEERLAAPSGGSPRRAIKPGEAQEELVTGTIRGN